MTDEIITVVLREAKKESLPYRRHAVEVLGRVVDDFQVDLFQPVFEMLQPLFRTSENESDTEDMEEEGHQVNTLEFHEAAVLALGRIFPLNVTTQGKLNSQGFFRIIVIIVTVIGIVIFMGIVIVVVNVNEWISYFYFGIFCFRLSHPSGFHSFQISLFEF